MAFDEIESHECEGGTIAVGTNRNGEPLVLMDGPAAKDVAILFNRVSIKHDYIEFRLEAGGPSTPVTGTIKGNPADYGDVGEWIIQHQEQALDQRGVA